MKKYKLISSLTLLGIGSLSFLPLTSCGTPTVIRTINFTHSEGVELFGDLTTTIENGKTWKEVTKPHVSVSAGYDDYGWYNGYEKLEDDSIIGEDFDARFIAIDSSLAIKYITLKIDNKVYEDLPILNTKTWAEFKETYGVPDAPTKEKCVLHGWYCGETKIEDDTLMSSDMTIETKFVTDFSNDTWASVISHLEEGLDKAKEYYMTDSFIGMSRQINLNKHVVPVKVIDELHDQRTGVTSKANLTFQTVDIIREADGKYAQTSVLDNEQTRSKDYIHSILRANLTGNGTPSKKTWDKTVIEMLMESEPELYTALKMVDKEITVYDESVSTKWEVKTYSDKLFILTMNEYNYQKEFVYLEGKPYKYWVQHPSLYDRVFGDSDYWIISPHTERPVYNFSFWYRSRQVMVQDPRYDDGITFAFCI